MDASRSCFTGWPHPSHLARGNGRWAGFPIPRHRFDPPSGRFRVRYAANDPVAAVRERFPARRIPATAASLHLVQITGPPRALHLTHQATLDALGVDDRINTGRLDTPLPRDRDPMLAVCQHLADALHDWWAPAPAPPIVYRTRHLPAARCMAFTEGCSWRATRSRPLRTATTLLVELVTRHGFDIPDSWLSGP